jgi:hypothetical protein
MNSEMLIQALDGKLASTCRLSMCVEVVEHASKVDHRLLVPCHPTYKFAYIYI